MFTAIDSSWNPTLSIASPTSLVTLIVVDPYDTPLETCMRVESHESDESFLLAADVPGFETDELNVEIDEAEKLLYISGNHKQRKERESRDRGGFKAHFASRSERHQIRVFRLPETVKVDSITSTHKNGVLVIQIPKLVPSAPTGTAVSHRRRVIEIT